LEDAAEAAASEAGEASEAEVSVAASAEVLEVEAAPRADGKTYFLRINIVTGTPSKLKFLRS